jgi:hypothetical protein
VRNVQIRMIRLFGGSELPGALIAIPDDSSDQQVQPDWQSQVRASDRR